MIVHNTSSTLSFHPPAFTNYVNVQCISSKRLAYAKTLKDQVFDHQVCQNPTLSHALTDILTLVLNKTLMNGDKNKQPRLKWCFEIRWKGWQRRFLKNTSKSCRSFSLILLLNWLIYDWTDTFRNVSMCFSINGINSNQCILNRIWCFVLIRAIERICRYIFRMCWRINSYNTNC